MIYMKSLNIILVLIGLSLSVVYNNNNNNNSLIFPNEYIVPKTLWLYWDGDFENITKYCFHKIKQNLNNYEIILLNRNTIRCYINSKDIPTILHTLCYPNQADYYRFQLLVQYGGIWMDASSFVKNDEVFDELINEMNEKKADLLAFNYRFHPNNNIELGILFSPRKSEFLDKVLYYYELGLRKGISMMMKKMIKEGMILKSTNQYSINNSTGKRFYNTYFYSFYCVQYVLQIIYKYSTNIILKRAEDWFFKFQRDFHWNGELMRKKLKEKNGLDNYKLIKFTRRHRESIKMDYFNEII